MCEYLAATPASAGLAQGRWWGDEVGGAAGHWASALSEQVCWTGDAVTISQG